MYTPSPCCSLPGAASGPRRSPLLPVRCQLVDCESATEFCRPWTSGATWWRPAGRSLLPAQCTALPAASPAPAHLQYRATQGFRIKMCLSLNIVFHVNWVNLDTNLYVRGCPTLKQEQLSHACPGLDGWSRAAFLLFLQTAAVEVETEPVIFWGWEELTQEETLLTHHHPWLCKHTQQSCGSEKYHQRLHCHSGEK